MRAFNALGEQVLGTSGIVEVEVETTPSYVLGSSWLAGWRNSPWLYYYRRIGVKLFQEYMGVLIFVGFFSFQRVALIDVDRDVLFLDR